MPVFTLQRPAPVGPNSLAAFEGRSLGAALSPFQMEQFNFQPIDGGANLRAQQITPEQNAQVAAATAPPGPSWWERNRNDVINVTGSGLHSALQIYSQTQAQRAARDQANAAAEASRIQQMLALESIRGSQEERELRERLAMLQAQAKGGMPSWVLPAAIGGGALVLVLVLAAGRKKAK